MNPIIREAFYAEQQEKSPRSIQVACFLAILAFVSFSLIDPLLVTATQKIKFIRLARLAIVLSICFVWASTYFSFGKKYIDIVGIMALFAVGGGVIVLIDLTGGGYSDYRDTLYWTFLGFALLVPCRPLSACLSLICLGTFYDILLYINQDTGPMHLWIANNAILWGGVITTIAGVIMSNRLREEEFVNRYLLTESNQKLKDLDKAKNQFFANVSHELRTPLTLILAPLDGVIADDALAMSLRDQLDICRRNGVRLLRLVDDLLELSKLEADSLRLKVTIFNLAQMAHDLVLQVQPLAQRRQIRVVADIPNDIKAEIMADDSQIERILLNLIANALKFTGEQGTVTVKVAEENNGVAVWVNDTGEGIAPKDLPFIFDRFYQAETGEKKRRSGVGIGLSLCKKIIDLHQGSISASSVVGQGTSMKFWLPSNLALGLQVTERRTEQLNASVDRRQAIGLSEWDDSLRSQDAYRLVMVEDATERRLTPRVHASKFDATVLVVDDNRDIVQLLFGILSADYQIYSAIDGEEALATAMLHQPDLIISDYMMPKKNGIELLQAIRQNAQLRDTPFIILTARGQIEDRIVAGEHGADVFLPKPFHPVELRTTVRRLLQKKEEQSVALLENRSMALRVMAEGIAHDVLNPLGFVKGSLLILNKLIAEALTFADTTQPRVAQIAAEAKNFYESGDEGVCRVTEAIGQLRNFSRSEQDEPLLPIDVNESVKRVLAVTAVNGKVTTELLATLPVKMRAGQLSQVLLNLIINAQQAGGAACEVSITTHDLAHEQAVVIVVQDNGPGMDKQTLKQIFDPYFTTKDMGTGLGLTVSRQIIREHGGTLSVESKLQEGTIFTIWLPADRSTDIPLKD